jgi:hypothetical protein
MVAVMFPKNLSSVKLYPKNETPRYAIRRERGKFEGGARIFGQLDIRERRTAEKQSCWRNLGSHLVSCSLLGGGGYGIVPSATCISPVRQVFLLVLTDRYFTHRV